MKINWVKQQQQKKAAPKPRNIFMKAQQSKSEQQNYWIINLILKDLLLTCIHLWIMARTLQK